MNEKKYTVTEFVEKYSKLGLDDMKVDLIKSSVTTTYLPYEQKCTVCDRIVNCTYYTKNEDGTKKLHVNSAARYMLYCLNIIDNYTNISVNYKDAMNEFDQLSRLAIIDQISVFIPERELKELNMLLDMAQNDIMQNEYEIHAFISSQVQRFTDLFSTAFAPAIDEVTKQLKGMDKKTLLRFLQGTKLRK